MKYYSLNNPECETCSSLEYFKTMIDESTPRLELKEWKRNRSDGTFWCSVDGEAFESSNGTCGIACATYGPRNGKSGRCRFHQNTMSPTDKVFVLDKNGLRRKKR